MVCLALSSVYFFWVLSVGIGIRLLHAERVFQLAPNNARILDTYGLAQLEAGNAGEAVRVLRRAVHAEPGNPEIQSHLAQALAKQGKRHGAI